MAIDKNLPPVAHNPLKGADGAELKFVKSEAVDQGGLRAHALLMKARNGDATARAGLEEMLSKLADPNVVAMFALGLAAFKQGEPHRRDLDVIPKSADEIKAFMTKFLKDSEAGKRAVSQAVSKFG